MFWSKCLISKNSRVIYQRSANFKTGRFFFPWIIYFFKILFFSQSIFISSKIQYSICKKFIFLNNKTILFALKFLVGT